MGVQPWLVARMMQGEWACRGSIIDVTWRGGEVEGECRVSGPTGASTYLVRLGGPLVNVNGSRNDLTIATIARSGLAR